MKLIIGAGQAGGHAAMAIRAAGHAGRIILLGDEPHAPYERPPLSKAMLTEEPAPPIQYFHDPARLAAQSIELRLGTRAEGIDAHARRVHLSGGETLPYDDLLLATGGRPRRLAIPGGETVLYLRTIEDAARIRARLLPGANIVCIGAGVIGLEIAASARACGCAVTVLEAGPGVMGRSLTPDFAAYIAALHASQGVDIRLGVRIEAIAANHVLTDTGRIPADMVVAGIGIARNTELAESAGAGLDNGILVDEFGRTNVPGIHAAGDVAAFWHPLFQRRLRLETWRNAQNQGIAVGRVMAGGGTPYDDIPWFWTDQHGINLQLAGLPDLATTTIWRGTLGDPSFTGFHLDASGRLAAATGVNAPREIRAAMALIAARATVDPAALADPSIPPQRLVADLRKRAG